MTLLEQIIAKHKEDREVIKALKKKHAEELRAIEEFQKRREDVLLERGDLSCFGYITDLFVNGREGKSELKKAEGNIALDQTKIENWLHKMLKGVANGINTEFGTVYMTRKESVTCGDFDMFVEKNMLEDAAKAVCKELLGADGRESETQVDIIVKTIKESMHLELINKSLNKEACLELMGEKQKDGSRPNVPPAGANYSAISCVGVRKAK